MHRYRYLLITILAFLASATMATSVTPAPEEKIIRVEVRPGIYQPYLLLTPPKPVASAIVFAGYGGYLNITDKGIRRSRKNFLVRTRYKLAEQGIAVAVIDVPSDFRRPTGILGWRSSKTHARDLAKVISSVYMNTGKPVFLVGTSRGTTSVANAGARLQHPHLAGLVLTATVTEPGGQNTGNVYDVPLKKITLPVLIVHNEDDECIVTTPHEARRLPRYLKRARSVKLVMVAGGKEAETRDCGPLSPHGFYGIEKKVIVIIARWITRMSNP